MVPQNLPQTPTTHSPSPSTSNPHLHARRPFSSKPSSSKYRKERIRTRDAPGTKDDNSTSPVLQPLRIMPDDTGHMRFTALTPDIPPTSNVADSSSGDSQLETAKMQLEEPSPQPSLPMRKNQFRAFGIPAYPTRASCNEICRKFVLDGSWCERGRYCKRVHPLDKATYCKKIAAACSVQQPPNATLTDVPLSEMDHKFVAMETVDPVPDSLQSLSLSNSTRSSTPQPVKSIEGDKGWDPNGSWMAISKPEDWTDPSSSPATSSNDQLFSAPSNSSSPTTASPEPSDDDKEEPSDDDKEEQPAPVHHRRPGANPCILFKRRGSCPRGDACLFKHVREPGEPLTDPLRSSETSTAPEVVRSETPVQASQTVDADAVKPVNSTTPAAPVRPPEPQAAPAPLPVRHPRLRSNQICRRWLQNACTYESCRYVHGNLEYDDEPSPRSSTGKSSSPLQQHSTPVDEFLLSFTLHDHMRVQCSAGFDIQRVQTAFESSTLLISNISHRVQPNHLKATVTSYGSVEDLHMPAVISPGMVVKVTYSDAAAAQKAQNALNGMKMYDLTITARIAASGAMKTAATALLKDTAVRITWEAPAKEVYAGYSNTEQALRAIQIARTTPLNGHYLKGEIYEGMPAVDVVNVHFRGVPVDVDKADLVRFVNPVDIMWTRPIYTDFDDGVRFIRNHLRECGNLEQFDVLPPPYRDGGMVRAWATFATAAKAKEAARHLDGRRPKCLGLTVVRAKHVQALSYTISPDKFSKLGAAIEALQASQRGSFTSVVIVPRPTGYVIVRLSADEQKELAHLKHQFEKILKGEVVRCDGKIVWDSYFTRREGLGFLQDLRTKNPAVHFENDDTRSQIRLYGFSADRARFADAIIAKWRDLRSRKELGIALNGRLLGAVISSGEIKRLRQKYGMDNSHFDMLRRMLYVRGDFTTYRIFKDAVEQIGQRLPTVTSYSGATCPICFDKPSSPVRLQCGHVWCRACIVHYFRAATEQKTFPLKCVGNEGRCSTKIPIGVAKEALSGQELQDIVNAAFLAYIQARPKEYHFCPTPDCPQIYRTTQQKATLQCPSCLTSICTRCHAEAHDGFQCADQVQDELFNKWMKEHDVKHCPTCNVPIERTEGCNHMTCTRCQTHICWQCMKTFPGGEGIYGHMREVHGTFGLGPILA